MFQPTHWGHHQASISEFKMLVHKRLVCQQDPMWFKPQGILLAYPSEWVETCSLNGIIINIHLKNVVF
jgi:hypothetical protein